MSSVITILVLIMALHNALCALYPGIHNLNWLCLDEGIYARNIPWDCQAYAICSGGKAYSFRCASTQNYNAILSTCEFDSSYGTNDCHQNPFNYLDILCLYNPRARIPSAVSCAQYFDCSQASGTRQYAKYVMECPYPDLFSSTTGKCESFRNVNCGNRVQTKAPCDYTQYKQICPDPKRCTECSKRHPSCVRKTDGFHSVPNTSKYYMFCLKERTLLVKQCPQNKIFSALNMRCI